MLGNLWGWKSEESVRFALISERLYQVQGPSPSVVSWFTHVLCLDSVSGIISDPGTYYVSSTQDWINWDQFWISCSYDLSLEN